MRVIDHRSSRQKPVLHLPSLMTVGLRWPGLCFKRRDSHLITVIGPEVGISAQSSWAEQRKWSQWIFSCFSEKIYEVLNAAEFGLFGGKVIGNWISSKLLQIVQQSRINHHNQNRAALRHWKLNNEPSHKSTPLIRQKSPDSQYSH